MVGVRSIQSSSNEPTLISQWLTIADELMVESSVGLLRPPLLTELLYLAILRTAVGQPQGDNTSWDETAQFQHHLPAGARSQVYAVDSRPT